MQNATNNTCQDVRCSFALFFFELFDGGRRSKLWWDGEKRVHAMFELQP